LGQNVQKPGGTQGALRGNFRVRGGHLKKKMVTERLSAGEDATWIEAEEEFEPLSETGPHRLGKQTGETPSKTPEEGLVVCTTLTNSKWKRCSSGGLLWGTWSPSFFATTPRPLYGPGALSLLGPYSGNCLEDGAG